MPKSSGEPKSEALDEASNREDVDQSGSRPVSEEEETASQQPSMAAEAPAQSQAWWSASPSTPDWAHLAATPSIDVDLPKESGTADVYFCGHTTLFPLNRALQAIAKEKLTGSLRSFWDQEPIDLLAQNGEILFATTRDSER